MAVRLKSRNPVSLFKDSLRKFLMRQPCKKGVRDLIDDSKDYAAGNSAYAVLLYTYGTGDDLQYMGNVGKVTFESAMDVDSESMGSFLLGNTTAGATAWSTAAVPEPTSGLLLLLGMAGLALKRKRA